MTWDSYGKELAGITEWYFLDEVGQRGHLFVQLLDTPQYKLKMHMPAGARDAVSNPDLSSRHPSLQRHKGRAEHK